MCVCVYIYSFRASNLLLDRSFNFLARPRRRKRRKKKKSIFLPKERIIPLDSTIEREREKEVVRRDYFQSRGRQIFGIGHIFLSRERERERRVLSYRGKIFFRGAFPVREIKEFEGTLNDTRRWQIRTSTEGEKRRQSIERVSSTFPSYCSIHISSGRAERKNVRRKFTTVKSFASGQTSFIHLAKDSSLTDRHFFFFFFFLLLRLFRYTFIFTVRTKLADPFVFNDPFFQSERERGDALLHSAILGIRDEILERIEADQPPRNFRQKQAVIRDTMHVWLTWHTCIARRAPSLSRLSRAVRAWSRNRLIFSEL